MLIDPSYELKTDYQDVVAALAEAHRRFATGTFLLWYPVIERARTDAMLAGLAATGIARQYRLELGLRPDAPGRGMTACGLVVVNPAWTLPAAADAALPWLASVCGADRADAAPSGWSRRRVWRYFLRSNSLELSIGITSLNFLTAASPTTIEQSLPDFDRSRPGLRA